MSLVTEIDGDFWYVFFLCVYVVHPRMICCIFVTFMFWDTISVKRVDWDMLCFCGEMVLIAKAKATNFQDSLQLSRCFSKGFLRKIRFRAPSLSTLVFFKVTRRIQSTYTMATCSAQIFGDCVKCLRGSCDDMMYDYTDYTTHFHMFSLLKQPSVLVILHHVHISARETTNIWIRFWLNHEGFYSLPVC